MILTTIALESDKAPYNVAEGSSQLSSEEMIRISNENKELRLLVKIDRIKVRNVGNYPNLFCKFRFADETPVKVGFKLYDLIHTRRIF